MSETLDSNETPNTSKYFCHSCSSSFFSAVIAEVLNYNTLFINQFNFSNFVIEF